MVSGVLISNLTTMKEVVTGSRTLNPGEKTSRLAVPFGAQYFEQRFVWAH